MAYSPSGEFLTYAGDGKEHKGKVTIVATATWKALHTIVGEHDVRPLLAQGLPDGSGRQGPEAAAERRGGPSGAASSVCWTVS